MLRQCLPDKTQPGIVEVLCTLLFIFLVSYINDEHSVYLLLKITGKIMESDFILMINQNDKLLLKLKKAITWNPRSAIR